MTFNHVCTSPRELSSYYCFLSDTYPYGVIMCVFREGLEDYLDGNGQSYGIVLVTLTVYSPIASWLIPSCLRSAKSAGSIGKMTFNPALIPPVQAGTLSPQLGLGLSYMPREQETLAHGDRRQFQCGFHHRRFYR
jgi:hypothetical protein